MEDSASNTGGPMPYTLERTLDPHYTHMTDAGEETEAQRMRVAYSGHHWKMTVLGFESRSVSSTTVRCYM